MICHCNGKGRYIKKANKLDSKDVHVFCACEKVIQVFSCNKLKFYNFGKEAEEEGLVVFSGSAHLQLPKTLLLLLLHVGFILIHDEVMKYAANDSRKCCL